MGCQSAICVMRNGNEDESEDEDDEEEEEEEQDENVLLTWESLSQIIFG